MPWRKERQLAPVFLSGKSHGQRSLVGYSPWDSKELDTTERLTLLVHRRFSGEFSPATWEAHVRSRPVKPQCPPGGFPGGSNHKESAWSAGESGSIPGLGRSPGEGMSTHSSILAWRFQGQRTWRATVHGVTKSWTRLSAYHDNTTV